MTTVTSDDYLRPPDWSVSEVRQHAETSYPAADTLNASVVVRTIAPGAFIVDNLLTEIEREGVRSFLHNGGSGGWTFGWKSSSKTDQYSFWHRHFAGYRRATGGAKYPCADELSRVAPFLFDLWIKLTPSVFEGHTLLRCYANAHTYGSDGTIHTDTRASNGYTSVYYPHAHWEPNWAGETVLFNDARSDVLVSVYPRPNRLLVFRGNIPHVARGVSRICPVQRITLIFKTECGIDDDAAGN